MLRELHDSFLFILQWNLVSVVRVRVRVQVWVRVSWGCWGCWCPLTGNVTLRSRAPRYRRRTGAGRLAWTARGGAELSGRGEGELGGDW